MNYADYEFYVTKYLGELDQDDFDRVIIKSSAHVRKITFGRADHHAEDESVKLATCAVCDIIAGSDRRTKLHNGLSIASENTDGYSVSYVNEHISGESTEELLNRKIYQAAEAYLLPTGLLDWSVFDDNEC